MKQLLLTVILYVLSASLLLAQYSGGTGSVDDPYKISTKTDLKSLSESDANWSMHFVLANDITFTEADFEEGGAFYNSGNGFIPIGGSYPYFTGTFNGQGYTIDGIYINRPDESRVGLFGCVKQGNDTRLENLKLVNVSIIGSYYVGGVVGDAYGVISNCEITGNVSGEKYVGGIVGDCSANLVISCSAQGKISSSDSYLGGLIGYTNSSAHTSVISCFSTASVIGGGDYIGGLVGYSYSATVSSCYAIGDVEGVYYVGGLIGRYGKATNCFAKGDVSGNNNVGGLVGRTGGEIANCYATGGVYGFGDYVGGLAGYSAYNVEECFYTSGNGTNEIGTPLNSDDFASITNFEKWDFDRYWSLATIDEIESGKDYPYLQWQTEAMQSVTFSIVDELNKEGVSNVEVFNDSILIGISNSKGVVAVDLPTGEYSIEFHAIEYFDRLVDVVFDENHLSQDVILTPTTKAAENYGGGDGTFENPYQIANLAHLRKLSQDKSNWDKCFIQVANIDAAETVSWNNGKGFSPIGKEYPDLFRGQYNGSGYIISGLCINRSNQEYVGVFGKIGSSLFVKETAVLKNINLKDANIIGAKNTGGIVGYTDFSSIENCNYEGLVIKNGAYTGGIAGHCILTGISSCNFEGEILVTNNNSDDFTGGIVGHCENVDSILLNCNYRGTILVDGSYGTGGIVGYLNGHIENCHFIGDITGGTYTGGVVGSVGTSISTIENSSVKGNLYGKGIIGGLVGKTWNNSSIDACFAGINVTNASTNNNSYTGGLIGDNNSIYIKNCYTVGDITRNGGFAGGLIGGCTSRDFSYVSYSYSTCIIDNIDAQLQGDDSDGDGFLYCYYLNRETNEGVNSNQQTVGKFSDINTFTGFDFSTTWSMGELPDIADGVRPYLQWQFAGRKQLNLKAEDEDNGDITDEVTLTGGGWCLPGATVTIKVDSENYNFLGWYDNNGNLISADNPYSFVMGSNNMQIKALLEATATGIPENKLSAVRIYTNPASEFIIVDQLKGKYVSGALYNISGILITNFELSNSINQYRLNIDSYPNGLYLLRLTASDDSFVIYKLYKK